MSNLQVKVTIEIIGRDNDWKPIGISYHFTRQFATKDNAVRWYETIKTIIHNLYRLGT